jgi:excisionase family DNA binding protein
VTEARLLRLLSAEAEAALVRLIDERVAQKLAENDGGQPAPTPFLTVKEAAVFLRTSQGAIRKRIERGQLKPHRPEGSPILLRRDELEQPLDRAARRSYDDHQLNRWPREADTSGAVTPGGTS